jgi:hypothetical protein
LREFTGEKCCKKIEHLTGARYKKLPYGPVPQKLDTIINQMIEKGQLKRILSNFK